MLSWAGGADVELDEPDPSGGREVGESELSDSCLDGIVGVLMVFVEEDPDERVRMDRGWEGTPLGPSADGEDDIPRQRQGGGARYRRGRQDVEDTAASCKSERKEAGELVWV